MIKFFQQSLSQPFIPFVKTPQFKDYQFYYSPRFRHQTPLREVYGPQALLLEGDGNQILPLNLFRFQTHLLRLFQFLTPLPRVYQLPTLERVIPRLKNHL